MQLLSVGTMRTVCDEAELPLLAVRGAGFVSDTELWALGTERPQGEAVLLRLSTESCRVLGVCRVLCYRPSTWRIGGAGRGFSGLWFGVERDHGLGTRTGG